MPQDKDKDKDKDKGSAPAVQNLEGSLHKTMTAAFSAKGMTTEAAAEKATASMPAAVAQFHTAREEITKSIHTRANLDDRATALLKGKARGKTLSKATTLAASAGTGATTSAQLAAEYKQKRPNTGRIGGPGPHAKSADIGLAMISVAKWAKRLP